MQDIIDKISSIKTAFSASSDKQALISAIKTHKAQISAKQKQLEALRNTTSIIARKNDQISKDVSSLAAKRNALSATLHSLESAKFKIAKELSEADERGMNLETKIADLQEKKAELEATLASIKKVNPLSLLVGIYEGLGIEFYNKSFAPASTDSKGGSSSEDVVICKVTNYDSNQVDVFKIDREAKSSAYCNKIWKFI